MLCGFCLCLLWSDVADGGVDPRTIIIAFDISEQFAPRGIAIGYSRWWTSSVFRVPKKLSIGALSQQFALRLIDWVIAAACRMSRYWLAAYWADSTDRHNTIFVGLSGDTGDRPRVASQ